MNMNDKKESERNETVTEASFTSISSRKIVKQKKSKLPTTKLQF